MKTIITFLALAFISTFAYATDINVSKPVREFRQYPEILQGQVQWAQQELDQYVEEALGCSKVRFHLNILKEPGIFSKGSFELKLTAKCTETFSNFDFIFYDGYDEDYTTLNISYLKDGKQVKKGFKTRAWY